MIVRYVRLSLWPSSLVALYGLPHATTLANEWPYIALVVVGRRFRTATHHRRGAAAPQCRALHATGASRVIAALAMTPSNADGHFPLADVLSGVDRFGEAVPYYQAYLAVNPRTVMALTNLAWRSRRRTAWRRRFRYFERPPTSHLRMRWFG